MNVETACRRLEGTSERRPLLEGECEKKLLKLVMERKRFYREVARFEVSGEGNVQEVADMTVKLIKSGIYGRVLLTHRKGETPIDVTDKLERALKQSPLRKRRVFLVISRRVASIYPALVDTVKKHTEVLGVYMFPDGEKYKSLAQVKNILESMAEAKLSRSDALLAIGGGVVGDTAGFAASIYMRGIDWAVIPTTLLAQVDSSIGGKTGVNTPMAKNIVGAFWQPVHVISDVSFLDTLPPRIYRSGLSEVLKYGAIMDEEFFNFVVENAHRIMNREKEVLLEVVFRCSKHKASVVEEDEEEKGGYRRILNFGHTFGHILESAYGYRTFYHGEAVAEGMKVAVRVSKLLDLTDSETVERLEEALLSLGFRSRWKVPDVEKYLLLDKKVSGDHIYFVALRKIGRAEIIKIKTKELVKCIKEVIR